ncbi:hypothetical protein MRB53_008536 [Persea americana]|uniref:Uncharacterized protein n=1 Tax=Persea americana TaxID=3435 RepID=A0ACC2MMR6_PERAE|nr:hypothetical protein MRB53_008536 [Persea americana]
MMFGDLNNHLRDSHTTLDHQVKPPHFILTSMVYCLSEESSPCNCSYCSMKGILHFVVPSSKFKLMEESEQFLTTYTFGTHTAKHTFCKVCGITSFYKQRSNPDGIAVSFSCVNPGTLVHTEIKEFDGRNWE